MTTGERALDRQISSAMPRAGGQLRGVHQTGATSADAVQIVLLEAEPQLVPGQSGEIAARKRELLEKNGVQVRLGAPVDAITSDHVIAGGARVEARTVV